MRLEKFHVVWKKRRMENFQYSRSINFRVFDGGMISVNDDCRDGQSGEKQIIFASRRNSVQARASLASAASISCVSAESDSFRPCGSKTGKRSSTCCCRKSFRVVRRT